MTDVGPSDHDVGVDETPEKAPPTTSDVELTTAEKIARIEASGWPLAWDGCHKIYFLQDRWRVAQAREFGYDLHDSTELTEMILGSCELVFVSRWGFDNPDFADALNIDQFTDDIYDEAASAQNPQATTWTRWPKNTTQDPRS